MKHRFLLGALVVTAFGAGVAAAAPTPSPKPPPRPADAKSPAAPAAPVGRQPVDVDVQSLQPYNLPPASRAKMRACGEEWRAIKLGGQADGWTWRTFAEKCLVK